MSFMSGGNPVNLSLDSTSAARHELNATSEQFSACSNAAVSKSSVKCVARSKSKFLL